MSRDYSSKINGIEEEYTSQSFITEASSPKRDFNLDVRGNQVMMPRGIPTQEEVDRLMGKNL